MKVKSKGLSKKSVDTRASRKSIMHPSKLAPIDERDAREGLECSSQINHNYRDSLINTTQKDSSAVNWYEIRPLGLIPERRAYHSTCVVTDTVYIYGGQDIREGTLDNMWSINLDFLEAKSNMGRSE